MKKSAAGPKVTQSMTQPKTKLAARATVKTTASNPPEKLRIGRELLDTTWRVAIPVLLFAVVGIVLDRALGSRPWMTLLGAAFGLYIAALLIKRQIMNGMNDTTDNTTHDTAHDTDGQKDKA